MFYKTFLRIHFICLVLCIIHLHDSSVSGTIVVTSAPPNDFLNVPYLAKLPTLRKILIVSVKPRRGCGDVFFAANTSYPIKKDVHVFICYESRWGFGIGLTHRRTRVEDKEFTFDSAGTASGFSLVLDDDSNSIVLLLNEEYVVFNHTFNPESLDIREFQYFALSGDAEWEVFNYY